MSDLKKECDKTNGKIEKEEAQCRLQECFQELSKAYHKTNEAYGSFKTKCFFFPEPEFTKSFKESLQQVETSLNAMGNTLKNLLSSGKKSSLQGGVSEEGKSSVKDELAENSFNSVADQSDVLAKVNLNITPPASEAGNDDEVATITQQPAKMSNKKRHPSREEENGKLVKKPRRNLIDDYFIKEKEDKAVENSSTQENKSSSEEVEYEVESIVSFKKVQSKFFYKVSWKGYSLEECTWEPSEHLTDCSEVLHEFYSKQIIEREKTSSKLEMNNQIIPIDRDLQHYLREAYLLYLSQSSHENMNKLIKHVVSVKNILSKEEINELVDKALSSRKVERYNSLKQTISDQVQLQTLQKKRSKQLAELRKWERSINSVCSDPAKIMVENEEDLELPPFEFVYINELKEGPGVTIPNEPVLGCECTDCFNSQSSCCASQMNTWFAYNKYGRLKVSLGTPIYECNKRCACPSTCNNRIVQKGRTFSLSIFRTANGRGWGVKALEPIKKDSFVVEYVGEVITSEEAEHRGELYDKKGCTYLFDLDFNKGDQNPYTVDAAKYGNVSHFINHSCDPNLVVFNVWVNCLDPDLPRLALFSCRDIKKGEELTFDYNSGLESEQMKTESAGLSADVSELSTEEDDSITPEKGGGGLLKGLNSSIVLRTPKGNRGLKYGKTKCRCGAANCRNYFF